MANYVKKTIISESYAHIEVVELTEAEKIDFEVSIKAYQAPRAKRMLGLDVEPVVRTEDGSLKVYLTVFGSVAEALGDFDDFRAALTGLYQSSRMVADACNLESLFLSGASKRNLIRAEARTGVVKQIRDISDLAVYMNDTLETFAHKRLSGMVLDLEKKCIKLNFNLTLAKDRVLVWQNLMPSLKKLPSKMKKLQTTPSPELLKVLTDQLSSLNKEVEKYHAAAAREIESESV